MSAMSVANAMGPKMRKTPTRKRKEELRVVDFSNGLAELMSQAER
jgi:hypothetical protein